jgi:hypothetical protein
MARGISTTALLAALFMQGKLGKKKIIKIELNFCAKRQFL